MGRPTLVLIVINLAFHTTILLARILGYHQISCLVSSPDCTQPPRRWPERTFDALSWTRESPLSLP